MSGSHYCCRPGRWTAHSSFSAAGLLQTQKFQILCSDEFGPNSNRAKKAWPQASKTQGHNFNHASAHSQNPACTIAPLDCLVPTSPSSREGSSVARPRLAVRSSIAERSDDGRGRRDVRHMYMSHLLCIDAPIHASIMHPCAVVY